MPVEHTLHVQPKGYLEPHNEGWVSKTISSVGFELRTVQFCVLCAIPLCQPSHIKNKNNKKNNTWKIKILLWFIPLEPISGNSNAPSVVPRDFWAYQCIYFLCTWVELMGKGLFTNLLRKFGLNIWTPMPIQWYKIKFGYDTGP